MGKVQAAWPGEENRVKHTDTYHNAFLETHAWAGLSDQLSLTFDAQVCDSSKQMTPPSRLPPPLRIVGLPASMLAAAAARPSWGPGLLSDSDSPLR